MSVMGINVTGIMDHSSGAGYVKRCHLFKSAAIAVVSI
jgi:hypothetical protein